MTASIEDAGSTHYTVGIGQRYDSIYLRNGTVRVEGFDIEYPAVPSAGDAAPESMLRVAGEQPYIPPRSMFTAMATQPIYDVGEQAFSTFLQAVDHGTELLALPVFPSRLFPHHEISVNQSAGIGRPADLAGKRVAIPFFSHNHAVWLRGALQHQYGVPLEAIVWVEYGEEHLDDYHPPARFKIEKADGGSSAAKLLEAGAVDAALAVRGVRSKSPTVQPLFEDPYSEIAEFLKLFPIHPVNTVLTVPRATLDKSRELPRAIFDAFQRALGLYVAGVRDGSREDEHSGLYVRRLERETGFRYPRYGFGVNRPTIDTMIEYCCEQGVIAKRLDAASIFVLTDS